MQPIVEFGWRTSRTKSTHTYSRVLNAELNLWTWLQFIFFRLSIFNEIISFSIKHILLFAINIEWNFPLDYRFRCSNSQFQFRVGESNQIIYLTVYMVVVISRSSASDFSLVFLGTFHSLSIFASYLSFFVFNPSLSRPLVLSLSISLHVEKCLTLNFSYVSIGDQIKKIGVSNRCILDYTYESSSHQLQSSAIFVC